MDNNLATYNRIFCDCFGVADEQQLPALQMKVSEQWNSVGHINLIAAIEEAFNIDMEPEDMFNFSSYTKGKEILTRKYNIPFNV